MKTTLPGRPGNEHTWHGDRPDWLDQLERGVSHVAVPVGALTILALGGGYLISEVIAWIR